jgi:hypothetical protein
MKWKTGLKTKYRLLISKPEKKNKINKFIY